MGGWRPTHWPSLLLALLLALPRPGPGGGGGADAVQSIDQALASCIWRVEVSSEAMLRSAWAIAVGDDGLTDGPVCITLTSTIELDLAAHGPLHTTESPLHMIVLVGADAPDGGGCCAGGASPADGGVPATGLFAVRTPVAVGAGGGDDASKDGEEQGGVASALDDDDANGASGVERSSPLLVVDGSGYVMLVNLTLDGGYDGAMLHRGDAPSSSSPPRALPPPPARGGVIDLPSTSSAHVSARRVLVRGGRAVDGGGCAVGKGAVLTLEGSALAGNAATARGGGLFQVGNGIVLLTDTLLVGNVAATSGGAAHVAGESIYTELVLERCMLRCNGAGPGVGAALFAQNAWVRLTDVSFEHAAVVVPVFDDSAADVATADGDRGAAAGPYDDDDLSIGALLATLDGMVAPALAAAYPGMVVLVGARLDAVRVKIRTSAPFGSGDGGCASPVASRAPLAGVTAITATRAPAPLIAAVAGSTIDLANVDAHADADDLTEPTFLQMRDPDEALVKDSRFVLTWHAGEIPSGGGSSDAADDRGAHAKDNDVMAAVVSLETSRPGLYAR